MKRNALEHKTEKIKETTKKAICSSMQSSEKCIIKFTMPDIKVSDQKPMRTISQDQMYNYFKNLSDEDQRLACSAIKVEFMIERIVGDLHQFDELKDKIKKMQEGF